MQYKLGETVDFKVHSSCKNIGWSAIFYCKTCFTLRALDVIPEGLYKEYDGSKFKPFYMAEEEALLLAKATRL